MIQSHKLKCDIKFMTTTLKLTCLSNHELNKGCSRKKGVGGGTELENGGTTNKILSFFIWIFQETLLTHLILIDFSSTPPSWCPFSWNSPKDIPSGYKQDLTEWAITYYLNGALLLAHLSTKCSWWAIVVSSCPSSVVVRRPSCVVCQHLMFTL